MHKKALASLTILFFMMGFITCLNDILVPFLKKLFDLDYAKASLIQFCFFGAYGLVSIPACKLIEKIGYHKSMVLGFFITSIGCLLFFPAVSYHVYGLFLFALFILASGIVILQVAANPYVSVLGDKETASSRLTMVQAFNSFGTFLAPFFGSFFILSALSDNNEADALRYPYLIIAFILVLIAFSIQRQTLPEIKSSLSTPQPWGEALRNRNLFRSFIGIFCYVGAEVTIGSFLINYIINMRPMPMTEAASLVAVYWGGAMVGRFLGIFTLKEFAPGKVLAVHALLAVALILISINSRGLMSVYSIVLVGLCNSIMFPTIFTFGIKDLVNGQEQKASGVLVAAIVGGAIVPLFTGEVVDRMGFRIAFLLPILCYAYIAILGLKNSKEPATENRL